MPSSTRELLKAFMFVAGEVRHYLQAYGGTLGLSPAELRVLRLLEETHAEGRNPPLCDFARTNARAKSSVHAIVKRLVARGLVRKIVARRDARTRPLVLTKDGERALATLEKIEGEAAETFFGALSVERRALLLELMDEMLGDED